MSNALQLIFVIFNYWLIESIDRRTITYSIGDFDMIGSYNAIRWCIKILCTSSKIQVWVITSHTTTSYRVYCRSKEAQMKFVFVLYFASNTSKCVPDLHIVECSSCFNRINLCIRRKESCVVKISNDVCKMAIVSHSFSFFKVSWRFLCFIILC